jgi:hypothetical protein
MDNDYFEDEFFDDSEDDMERIEDECGYDPAFPGICHDVGSEHCSFWCPLHHLYFNQEKS